MSTTKTASLRPERLAMLAISLLLAGLAAGTAIAGVDAENIVIAADATTNGDQAAPPARTNQDEVIIRSIEPERKKHAASKVTWLGVSVEEVPEALVDQLALKPGEGMMIIYVHSNSPAARAELRKHDVLVALDDQILVDHAQLRKLVQMHKEGDSVKITFFRGGKKQSVTAKLEKKSWNESSLDMGPLQANDLKLQAELRGLDGARDDLDNQMSVLAESLAQSGVDKEKMQKEIRETMEQTRKAIQDAMRNSQGVLEAQKALESVNRELSALAGSGMALGKDTTVVIKNEGKPTRTLVETDESGSYVIVASPKKHLIAHDQNGKLLFDGDIETHEQQEKVPRKVWKRVKPLLAEMEEGRIIVKTPAPQAEEPESEKP